MSYLIGNNWAIHFKEKNTASGLVRTTLILYCAKGTANQNTEPQDIFGEQKAIQLLPLNPITTSYDERNFEFAISTFTLSVLDNNKILSEAIFSQKFDADKSQIIIEIKKHNSNIWENFFQGYPDNSINSLSFNTKTKILDILFAPKTERLSETPVLVDGLFNDKLNYSFTPNTIINLHEILEKILKIVHPNFEVEIESNWLFKTPLISGNEYTGDITNVGVAWIYLFGYYNHNAQWVWHPSTTTYKEALKNLLKTMGLVLLFTSYNKAKCFHYFSYSVPNIYIPEKVKEYSHHNYRNKLKSFSLKSLRENRSLTGTNGTLTSIPEDNFVLQIPTYSATFEFAILYLWVDQLSSFVHINRINLYPINPNSFLQTLVAISYGYTKFFLNQLSSRRDELSEIGINYNYKDKIYYNNIFYLPVEISLDIQNCETKYKLLPIDTAAGLQTIDPNTITISDPGEPQSGTSIGNNIYGEILNTNEFLENNIPTNFKFIPGSTKLHRNGLRLKLNDDYTEGENTQSIILLLPAQEEDILLIDYVKQ